MGRCDASDGERGGKHSLLPTSPRTHGDCAPRRPILMRSLAKSALAAGVLIALVAGARLSTRAQAAPAPESKATLTQGFAKGTLDYKAIGPMAFSPSGVLFFADDQAGAIYGVDLGEKATAVKSYA